MEEAISLGHPSEFFRDLKKIFGSLDSDMTLLGPEKKLELVKTPIEGVARFEAELRGRCHHEVVKKYQQIVGALALCAAALGTWISLFVLNLQGPSYLIALGGVFVLFVIGGITLASAKSHYYADLLLNFEGEAYQAKAVEEQVERVTIFSRAVLKTDWRSSVGKLPSEFTKRMEENNLKLDLEIAGITPIFKSDKDEAVQLLTISKSETILASPPIHVSAYLDSSR